MITVLYIVPVFASVLGNVVLVASGLMLAGILSELGRAGPLQASTLDDYEGGC